MKQNFYNVGETNTKLISKDEPLARFAEHVYIYEQPLFIPLDAKNIERRGYLDLVAHELLLPIIYTGSELRAGIKPSKIGVGKIISAREVNSEFFKIKWQPIGVIESILIYEELFNLLNSYDFKLSRQVVKQISDLLASYLV